MSFVGKFFWIFDKRLSTTVNVGNLFLIICKWLLLDGKYSPQGQLTLPFFPGAFLCADEGTSSKDCFSPSSVKFSQVQSSSVKFRQGARFDFEATSENPETRESENIRRDHTRQAQSRAAFEFSLRPRNLFSRKILLLSWKISSNFPSSVLIKLLLPFISRNITGNAFSFLLGLRAAHFLFPATWRITAGRDGRKRLAHLGMLNLTKVRNEKGA